MSEVRPSEIDFNYIKSPEYRTAHIDGAFGGITPKGNISVALFSERLPIPTTTTHLLDAGTIGQEIRRDVRGAIIRELEVNCIMDIDTARIVAKFLTDKANELEKITEAQKNATAG